ncbi:MAG: hypothetical protein R3B09_23395 [Nannocystaceae bacterium]
MSRLHEVSVDFEVPFHDVDALRIVWHGHYYKYMEAEPDAPPAPAALDALGSAGAAIISSWSTPAAATPRRSATAIAAR